MADAAAEVIGASPLAYSDTLGSQQVLPLEALEFQGSTLQLKAAWAAVVPVAEQAALLELAKVRARNGELTPPPERPPSSALLVVARSTGPHANGTIVTAASETGKPILAAGIEFTATRTDTWPGLATGAEAEQQVGVDEEPADDTEPPLGTGLVVLEKDSSGATAKLPVPSAGVLKKTEAVSLKDEDDKVVAKLLPAADYVGKGGLSYEVVVEDETFTLSATYDSTLEEGVQDPVTLLNLDDLADPVAYLVKVSAPPRGAALPSGAVTLTGGAEGVAASGLLFMS